MPNSATQLQQKIRSTIPLSEAMQFEIAELSSNSIRVHAPLAPNINIHGTGFAGSIYSLAVLTGWALCTHIMDLHDLKGQLVVGKADIKYRSAITGDLNCYCTVSDKDISEAKSRFSESGKCRLTLTIKVGEEQALLNGFFFIT